MGNIVDYLKEYGDCPISQMPFNDVDSLVLCQLSYLKFDGIVPERHKFVCWQTQIEYLRRPVA